MIHSEDYWSKRLTGKEPVQVQKAIKRVWDAYPNSCLPQGTSDPMSIMNIMAFELGIGNGRGLFNLPTSNQAANTGATGMYNKQLAAAHERIGGLTYLLEQFISGRNDTGLRTVAHKALEKQTINEGKKVEEAPVQEKPRAQLSKAQLSAALELLRHRQEIIVIDGEETDPETGEETRYYADLLKQQGYVLELLEIHKVLDLDRFI